MLTIQGGITAPKGFMASGIHCGIKKTSSKKDLALIYSSENCTAAAVYTTNIVKGAPIHVTMTHLKDGYAKAMICNSGNANTCNKDGIEVAEKTCLALADELSISKEDVIVASTGVIGQPLNLKAILDGIPWLVKNLSGNGSNDAGTAIMTTDTVLKEVAVLISIGGREVKIGGIAKGSGMINPNMATLLSFITTDAAISVDMLKKALTESVGKSYNRITVDGDTSTNDMVSIMASGLAQNAVITEKNEDYSIFLSALDYINITLAKMMAKDGEGATKLIICRCNSNNEESAKKIAKTVVSSSLVKTAIFGADANWGRIMCAAGYSGEKFNVDMVDINLSSRAGNINVCENGTGLNFDEALAHEILVQDEIEINITIKNNENDYSSYGIAYGCDLTYDYVKINGDYRT